MEFPVKPLRNGDLQDIPDAAELIDAAQENAKEALRQANLLREEVASLRIRLGQAHQEIGRLKERIKLLRGEK